MASHRGFESAVPRLRDHEPNSCIKVLSPWPPFWRFSLFSSLRASRSDISWLVPNELPGAIFGCPLRLASIVLIESKCDVSGETDVFFTGFIFQDVNSLGVRHISSVGYSRLQRRARKARILSDRAFIGCRDRIASPSTHFRDATCVAKMLRQTCGPAAAGL